MRQHDARTERERAMAVENQRVEALRKAFEDAPVIINGAQSQAITDLIVDGVQAGGTPAVPIPKSVAVAGTGVRGTDLYGDPFQTLALLAEDGRMWSLTGAGVCWPGGTTFQEARRAH